MKKRILKERIEFLETHIEWLAEVVLSRNATIAELKAELALANPRPYWADWTYYPYDNPYWLGPSSTTGQIQETIITVECKPCNDLSSFI